MNFAIIDDDVKFAEQLYNRITHLCFKSGYNAIVSCFSEAEPVFEENRFESFDIIFLDIEMPEPNGIKVAEKINALRKNSPVPYIVFVTSKDNLVFEALKTLPYSFVRKSELDDIDLCINSLCKRLTYTPTYSIKDGRNVKTIEINDIIRIEKFKNYTVFYTNSETYTERTNIEQKHKDLAKYHFLRPNIGSLVNAEHILECKNDSIIMSDKTTIIISRSYKKAFKEELHKWMRR